MSVLGPELFARSWSFFILQDQCPEVHMSFGKPWMVNTVMNNLLLFQNKQDNHLGAGLYLLRAGCAEARVPEPSRTTPAAGRAQAQARLRVPLPRTPEPGARGLLPATPGSHIWLPPGRSGLQAADSGCPEPRRVPALLHVLLLPRSIQSPGARSRRATGQPSGVIRAASGYAPGVSWISG